MKARLAGALVLLWGIVGIGIIAFGFSQGANFTAITAVSILIRVGFLVGGAGIVIGSNYGYYIALPLVALQLGIDLFTASLIGIFIDIIVFGALVRGYFA